MKFVFRKSHPAKALFFESIFEKSNFENFTPKNFVSINSKLDVSSNENSDITNNVFLMFELFIKLSSNLVLWIMLPDQSVLLRSFDLKNVLIIFERANLESDRSLFSNFTPKNFTNEKSLNRISLLEKSTNCISLNQKIVLFKF